MSKELKKLADKYNLHVLDTDAMVKLSSSRVNNMCLYITLGRLLRGIRIKQFRPDTIELIWVGKDFDFNDKDLRSILYSVIPNVLGPRANSNITIDLIQRQKFIDDMRRNSEINTNTSK